MKKSFLVLIVLVTTSVASADCFNFVNDQGPQQIGNFQLAARATQVCVNRVNRFGGDSDLSLVLSDSQGTLVIAAGELTSTGTSDGFWQKMTLSSGNINGDNVDLTGTNVEIQTETDSSLGVNMGVMSIQAGRDFVQKYLVINAN